MLMDQIIDSAAELASDNALWMEMQDVDIVHRVAQMVHEHITVDDKYGKLAIASYRWNSNKTWKNHNDVAELEARLLAV